MDAITENLLQTKAMYREDPIRKLEDQLHEAQMVILEMWESPIPDVRAWASHLHYRLELLPAFRPCPDPSPSKSASSMPSK